jgi:DNA polymerase-4
MDAFFASVEQRDFPELLGKPIAVGSASGRGVVAAASYEARVFGVRSAMPSATALRRCPELILVPPRFDVYREVSRRIRAIFRQYSPHVEPLSLDEAYIDVSPERGGDIQRIGSATAIAAMIRADIAAQTGLTASAGVSYNKFLAKLASDQNKPNGMCVIRPAAGADFVAGQPVKRFHGVGPRTAEKMARLGIATGGDLRGWSEADLRVHFGKFAHYLFWAARGIDHREVRADRERKSVGGERTYGRDLHDEDEVRAALEAIITIVWDRIESHGAQGRTIILKAKYSDFQSVTRSSTAEHSVHDKAKFALIAHRLLDELLPLEKGVRLLGLTLAGLAGTGQQRSGSAPPDARAMAVQQRFAF